MRLSLLGRRTLDACSNINAENVNVMSKPHASRRADAGGPERHRRLGGGRRPLLYRFLGGRGGCGDHLHPDVVVLRCKPLHRRKKRAASLQPQ